jgi:Leucine-rich repeat (LRR) protein
MRAFSISTITVCEDVLQVSSQLESSKFTTILVFSDRFSSLLLVAALAAQTSANCRFSGNIGEQYTCDATGVTYLQVNDGINLSGNHEGTRKDENVRRIVFSESQLVTIPASVFDKFVNLETFTARNVGMQRIELDRARCSVLFHLYLDNNRITRLENDVFRNCRASLQEISLEANQIDFIGANVFRIMMWLRYVNLQNNRLTTIDPNLFFSMNNLETVLLGFNQLTTLSPTTFRHTPPLNYIGLENNRITHIPAGMFTNQWLRKVALNNNMISSIGEGAIQGFGSQGRIRCILDLHHNQLTRLSSDIFNGSFANIGTFSIGNNQINAIEPNFFSFLRGTFSFMAPGNVCIDKSILNVDSTTVTGAEKCFKNF